MSKDRMYGDLIAKAMEESASRRIIVCDLDGTLAVEGEWKGYGHIGAPIESTIKELRAEKRKGSFIIIHTCRVTTLDNKVLPESLDTIRKWLRKNRVPYNEIWTGTGKPYGHEYWDDKAVRKPSQ